VTLAELPRTRHGKVDVRALPAPELPADSAPVPPRTEAERALAGVIGEVLGRSAVGVHDNFFDLRGDSILAMSVVTRARQRSIDLTVRELFQNPTVAGVAAVAGTRPTGDADAATVTGPVPLTPIQHWFFDQELTEPSHWNMCVHLGLTEPLRPDLLQEAFRAVLHHHDALRLRFTRQDGQWRAHNAPPNPTGLCTPSTCPRYHPETATPSWWHMPSGCSVRWTWPPARCCAPRWSTVDRTAPTGC
jgi:aryl carrier-like protein